MTISITRPDRADRQSEPDLTESAESPIASAHLSGVGEE